MKSQFQIPILTDDHLNKVLNEKQKLPYLAMYSSHFGGIIKDPKWMMLPIDDHIVHRGDGVFEAIKFLNSKIYGCDEHLARLMRSAAAIELDPQRSIAEIKDIIIQTIHVSQSPDGLIRLYLSRGPGGFTTNPYDCARAGLYIVITPFKAYPKDKYQNGVSAKISKYLAKEGFYSQIKSCNYLQNVLMKKDAVDSGVDFTVAVDHEGFITEGSTENCAFISKDGLLLIPSFQNTLRGITLTRMIELAQSLKETGEIKGIQELRISQKEVFSAREMAFVGTTLDVLPVRSLNDQKFGDGRPGPIFRKLLELLIKDIDSADSRLNTRIKDIV
jgi:4-amino-4-deoxychorismate lyase